MFFAKYIVFVFLIYLFVIVNNPTSSKSVFNQRKSATRTTTVTTTEAPAKEDDDDNDDEAEQAPAKPLRLKDKSKVKAQDDADDKKDDDGNNATDGPDDDSSNSTFSTTTDDSMTTPAGEVCVPPSINDFPTDLFSQRQRRFGAIIFHVAFAVYLFICITRLCDDYFMSSLEIIGQKLNLDQDVAGATFMAAGSSAPEVFISLIGIFVSESNMGIGAIVGSAVFNILFVIGICGLFIAGTARLTVWPFFRDSVFYCIAILMLVLLIRDDKVYWYESLVLLLLYAGYIVFMMNNDRLKKLAYEKFKVLEQEAKNILPESGGNKVLTPDNKMHGFFSKRAPVPSQSGYNRFDEEGEMYAWGGTLENISDHQQSTSTYQNTGGAFMRQNPNVDYHSMRNADALVATNPRQIDFDTAALHIMMDKRYFGPKCRFKSAVRRVIDEMLWIKRHTAKPEQQNYQQVLNFDCNPLNKANYLVFLADMPNMQEQGGLVKFILWAVFVPVRILFHFTIPDCRVDKYKQYYVATFVLSIAWLAVFSYLIIWMITVIGYTLGIPDSLMAVTFIAAGTSIPDAYTSIVVVKEGMVDMGVSNIIGSNVFDLLIGLALPMFIKSIFNGGFVQINSSGLSYDSFLLFACVVVTILIIHFRKWQLDRRSGYVFLSVYVAFLIFSSAIELNLFSLVNPPMC